MKTNRICLLAIALAVLAAPFASAKESPRKKSAEKPLPLAGLEGNWKIVSTNWEGAQNGYPPEAQHSPLDNMVYAGLVMKISVDSNGGAAAIDNSTETQFVLSFSQPYDKNAAGMTFCGERHPNSPNSYSLYLGYPRPRFWHLKEYPCELKESLYFTVDDRTAAKLSMERYLVRIDVKDSSHAHAVIAFTSSMYLAGTEADKARAFGDLPAKCDGKICYFGVTDSTAIAELELVKVSKTK